SIPPLDLYNAIKACSDDLIQFGGHSQAAGLTLYADQVDRFREDFCRTVAERLQPRDFEPEINIDVFLKKDHAITLDLLHQLEHLEPFGCGNEAPVFALRDAVLHSPRTVGREQNHLRLFAEYGGVSYNSIMWQGGALLPAVGSNTKADLAFLPKINFFRGMESVNLQLLAIRQPLTIFDYRQQAGEKADIVRAFLRSEPSVTLFVNGGSASAEPFADSPNLTVRHYGERCGSGERVVLLYDLPRQDIFTPEAFPLEGQVGEMLGLLYGWRDFREAMDGLEAELPGHAHLSLAYRYIYRTLRSQAVCKIGPLKESAASSQVPLSDTDLQIFEELHFFRRQEDELTMGSRQRRSLTESPTFCDRQKQGDALRELFNNCLKITRQRIYALWRR
ncbi:MAG TPA: hypothetical protein DHV71_02575, partial [Acidaminococcaceae bacterium]|nr:hypothetical protein [Acidaminococcaceae bacterium]